MGAYRSNVCAYKYRHTCLCLYLVYGCVLNVSVDIYIYKCTRERHHRYILIHCVRTGIHAYVSVFVPVCVCIHIYMYGRRVYICACICLRICTPSLQV